MKREDEKVLYSDGSTVTVTESVLQVKKTGYDLTGITKYGLSILAPVRLPWVIVLVAGVGLITAGIMKWVPSALVDEYYLNDILVTGNLEAVLVGMLLTLTSLGFLLSLSERYAVSITTAAGEQNVVVSRRKEYVTCIVNALNSAFFARIQSKGQGKAREFQVSHR